MLKVSTCPRDGDLCGARGIIPILIPKVITTRPLPSSPSPRGKNSHIQIRICEDPHGYLHRQILTAIPSSNTLIQQQTNMFLSKEIRNVIHITSATLLIFTKFTCWLQFEALKKVMYIHLLH